MNKIPKYTEWKNLKFTIFQQLFPPTKPAAFFHRFLAMAIGTQNIAFIYFGLEGRSWVSTCNHFTDGSIFSVSVVKFQNNRITLATANAGMS